jgi:hypothetical protein
MYRSRTCIPFIEGLSIADMTCFSGGIDTAFAQLCNRFPYLREELHSSQCPYRFLMLDKAVLDLSIQVGKDYPEVVLIAAKRLRRDLHWRCRILLQGIFQLFPNTLLAQGLV